MNAVETAQGLLQSQVQWRQTNNCHNRVVVLVFITLLPTNTNVYSVCLVLRGKFEPWEIHCDIETHTYAHTHGTHAP